MNKYMPIVNIYYMYLNYKEYLAYCKYLGYIMLLLLSDNRLAVHLIHQNHAFVQPKQYTEQIDYIRTITETVPNDWELIKTNVLSKFGNINEKNYEALMLKCMASSRHIDVALSFGDYLRKTNNELNVGSISALINLYTLVAKENPLSEDQKQFILDTYKHLYDKYKVLDFATSEKLLHALCAINEPEKAVKVLSDIHLTCTPSHSAYSTLIALYFKLNKKKKALELIEESVLHKRPLQEAAYTEWTNYILRKYKDKKVIAKHLEEICMHIAKYCVIVDADTARRFKDTFGSLEWNVTYTKIRKYDGQCLHCKEKLDCLKLTPKEFDVLQQNVKNKLIVGSDLFLKTSPEELKRFLNFVDSTAPYDIVLDALNISYAVGKSSNANRLKILNEVVDYFIKQNKKVLVLGRKHMLTWQKRILEEISRKASTFFTDDLSQDDPYFITAAILSGSHTDLMSKDLLRGHKFVLKDENLRNLFRRWQWQHQWMLFMNVKKGVIIQPPLKFTPCAQKKNNIWHLPYQRETELTTSQFNDGTPDLSSWLCLRP